jgi:hypothetical protein
MRRVLHLVAICAATAFAAVASQAAPPPTCTPTSLARVRARANELSRARQLQQAIRILSAARDACPLAESDTGESGAEAYGWLVTDLARAELAAGNLQACLARSKPELVPSIGHLAAALADPDTSPVLRALARVGERCEAAVERRYAFLEPDACFGDACPRLAPRAAPAASVESRCPALELSGAKGTRVTELGATAGPLVDTGYCCGLALVSAGVRDGTRFVRVRSEGAVSSCDDGEAKAVLDAVYALEGERRLRLISDLSYQLE